jgi:hypothetical protein
VKLVAGRSYWYERLLIKTGLSTSLCFCFALLVVDEYYGDFAPIDAPGSRPSAIIHSVCRFGKSRMHETRQSRIARLTETIRRHRYTLVQSKRILKIVPPKRKDEVLTQMRENGGQAAGNGERVARSLRAANSRGVDTVTVSECNRDLSSE